MARILKLAPEVVAHIYRVKGEIAMAHQAAPAATTNQVLEQALAAFRGAQFRPEAPAWRRRMDEQRRARFAESIERET